MTDTVIDFYLSRLPMIDFEQEMQGGFIAPLTDAPEPQALKASCYSRLLFDIYNGCKKTIHELTQTNQVEMHCLHMKMLAPPFARGRWPRSLKYYGVRG